MLHPESDACLTACYVAGKGGSKHGLGTYTWPNMAAYKGEWQNGCMHGVGTFNSPDGTMYEVSLQPLTLTALHSDSMLFISDNAAASDCNISLQAQRGLAS